MNEGDARIPWLRLFLPFAAGYLLSYLFRTSNAVIGPLLAAELALPDHALGLLTSTYFLAFGAAQLPLGMLLDRYGPRRVEAALLVVAAGGATVFAMAPDLLGLACGRALIGLGVSACLMAAFKAFNESVPRERQASMIGWIMSAGGLGAVFAAHPLASAIEWAGWRGVMLALAVATLLAAAAIFRFVPERPRSVTDLDWRAQLAGVRRVMTDRVFWRYAPMVTMAIGGFMAIQGLWVSRWLAEVEGQARGAIALQLTMLNGAWLAGCIFMGFAATPLQRRGITDAMLVRLAAVGALTAFGAINLLAGAQQVWPWLLLGFVFPLCNGAYALVAHALPLQLSGRANTALNLAAFAGAFALQWGLGVLVDALRAEGFAPASAYRIAFALLFALQAAAVAWMLSAPRAQRPGTQAPG